MGQHRHKPSPYAVADRARRSGRRDAIAEIPLGLLLGTGASAFLLGFLVGLIVQM